MQFVDKNRTVRRIRPLFALIFALTFANATVAGEAAAEPAAREGSGTGWLPESTPIAGHGDTRGRWGRMLHYNVFAGVSLRNAPESRAEEFTSNWVMGMARRRGTRGTVTLTGMISLEAPALGSAGYPLVLQTGETADGVPLVDRQHPHDLFMELAVRYDRPVGRRLGVQLYLAPVGEPALGPTAFPHRASAAADPMAPLGHHWQDSTHIAFGVATAAVHGRRSKLEVSAFNGREPDENRTDFDFGPLDSYAARWTVNPSRYWSVQASVGKLIEPETLEPDSDARRWTASSAHTRPLPTGNWASTLIWGRNEPTGERASAAFLAESVWTVGAHAVFGRAEYVQKGGHDFALDGEFAHARLPVRAVSLGYSRRIANVSGVAFTVGGRVGVGAVGEILERRYGTSRPVSGALFLRIHPAGGGKPSHPHHGV